MFFHLYRLLRLVFQLPAAALGLQPHSCRLTPSCSRYCELAVSRFGVVSGGWLCVKRVLRCGPWTPPGNDPVPES